MPDRSTMVGPGKRQREESANVTVGSRAPRRVATVFEAVAGITPPFQYDHDRPFSTD